MAQIGRSRMRKLARICRNLAREAHARLPLLLCLVLAVSLGGGEYARAQGLVQQVIRLNAPWGPGETRTPSTYDRPADPHAGIGQWAALDIRKGNWEGGWPVRAAHSGTANFVQETVGGKPKPNICLNSDALGIQTFYTHIRYDLPPVNAGRGDSRAVNAGDIIGFVLKQSETDFALTEVSHLHFEVRVKGAAERCTKEYGVYDVRYVELDWQRPFRPSQAYGFVPGTNRRIDGDVITSEDCLGFRPNQARVQRIEGRWKVVVGDRWRKDFGADEQQARKALEIIQRYGITQQCFVGRPNPSMEYYLVDGAAPTGSVPGEDCPRFDLGRLEAKKTPQGWKIAEGDRSILHFGSMEHEARAALAFIRAYDFSRICFIGRPNASMTYFRK